MKNPLRRWLEIPSPGGQLLTGAALDALVQRRMYWFGAGFLAALAPLYLAMTLVREGTARTWLVLAVVFGGLALNVAWVRRHRDFARGLGWLHGTVFLGVFIGALLEPGINRSSFWWMTVIPFVAILSGHTRLGVAQGVVVVGYTVVNFVLTPEPAAAAARLEGLRLHVAVALSTVYACAYLTLATLWRRQLQEALERARGEAATAAAAKARFLANMSHEIRTPLNGVIGAAELLRSGHTSDAQRRQLASLQEQSAKALLALINDVLDWSKLEADKLTLEAEPVYLRGLVFESNELFAVTAFDKGIELTSSCNPDVPRRFIGDATRLRQMVNNLVSNAVKFTHQGGVHVHLAMEGVDPQRSAVVPRAVRIEVADSGIGISPDQLARLFQPFHQADASVTRLYGGTGLGLSISQELARRMGGRIEVSSTPGQGSTFTLVLPLQAEAEAAALAAPRRGQGVVLASASAGLVRHLRSLLHELAIEPEVQRGLPDDATLADCRLLLLDSPLLAALPEPGPWLARQAALGRRVVVLAPLNADAMPATLPAGLVLYKPVRRAALAALLDLRSDGAEPLAAPPPAPAGLRVLLCEDNPVNQIVVQAMLAEAGASSTVAGNGEEALQLLRAESFDLVLMDLQMPLLDGLAAARRWRALEAEQGLPHLPIVAMTANAEGEEGAACRAAGMDGFLSKPFGLGALRQCLAQHARRRQVA
jgi:signal transduction histidine kinase/ActR/RegA family two-component response regulator